MKKICMFFSVIIVFSASLFSQIGEKSFLTYIEQLQYNNPEEAISWFATNNYQKEFGVSENVFCFYRGISRYTSYVLFQGSLIELNKGSSDFRRALNIDKDTVFYYSDRALLFIGGIIMISRDDKEIAGRIFEYFVNTSKGDNPYYTTALYWSARLGFVDMPTYESYYITLEQLSENPKNLVYDYTTANVKTLKEMFKKLPPPLKARLQRFNWTRDDISVYSLIEGAIDLYPVNDKETATQTIAADNNQQAGTDLVLPPSVATKKEQLVATVIKKTALEKVLTEEDSIQVIPIAPPIPLETVQTQNSLLKIMVNKTSSSGALRIDIGTNILNTTVSTNMILSLQEGIYPVSVYMLRGIYQATVVIDKNKNNIFSIVVDDSKLQQKKYILTSNGISTLLINEAEKTGAVSGATTIAEIRNVLAQSGTAAARWFELNPYNSSMGITAEEYAYYRGVAYYMRFITEGKRSAEYAAQAKADLEFALRKKDDIDLLVKTELYLAAVNIYAYGNLYDADNYLKQTEQRVNKNNSYYPTIVYWRLRIGAINATERRDYYNILRLMPSSTSIVDYSTTKVETLNYMMPALDRTTSITPVNQVKAILPNPQKEQPRKPALKANNASPTIPFYANYGAADTYSLIISSIDKTETLPYKGFLYSGENDLVIKSYRKTIPVKVVVDDSDSISLLVIAVQ